MDWQQTLQTVLSSLLPQQPPQPVAPAPPPPPQPSLGSVLGSILGGAAGASQWSDGTHFAPPPPQAKLPMGQGALTLAAVQQLASLLQQQQTAAPQQLQAPQAQQVQHLLRQVQQPQLEQQVQQPQLELQQVQQQDTQQAQLQQTQQQQAQQQHAQQQQEQPPLDGFAAFAPVAQALVSAPSVASAGAVAASGAASGGAPARQEAQNPALVRRAPGDDSSYNQLAPAVQQSGLEDAAGATTDTGGSGPGDASVGPASEAQPQQPGSELPTEELVRQVAAALPDLTHTAALLRKAAEQLQAHLAAQRLLQGEAAALAAQLPGARVLAGPNAGVDGRSQCKLGLGGRSGGQHLDARQLEPVSERPWGAQEDGKLGTSRASRAGVTELDVLNAIHKHAPHPCFAEVAELCVTTLLGLLDGVGKSPRSGAAAGEAAAAQPGPEPFAPAAAPQDELVGTAPAGAGLPSAVPRG